MASAETTGVKLESIGAAALRYSLVMVFVWIGLLKFTAYEAEGIQPLVSNSPLMSWGYRVLDVRGFSRFLGVTEILTGVLIALHKVAPRVSAVGSAAAIFTFLITLSFLLTTPGTWQPGYGFPFLSPMPGQFVAKDVILLAAAIWTAGESLRAIGREPALVRH